MKRLLITYVSHSGSTREVAGFLCDEIAAQGRLVDVRPISEVSDISHYDGIIAGGLLYRFGWHPEIVRFLEQNLEMLQQKKVALFVTGLRLLKTPQPEPVSCPVFIDPNILGRPANRLKLNLIDQFTTTGGYLKPALAAIDKLKPVSLGFFAGKLDLHTLNLPEKVIMVLLMLFTGVKAGDHRNWEAMRAWVGSLSLFNE